VDDEEEEADAIDDAIVDEVVGEDAVTIVDNSPSISSKVKVKATKKKTPPKKAKKAKPRAPARPATASAVGVRLPIHIRQGAQVEISHHVCLYRLKQCH
jgi:transposase